MVDTTQKQLTTTNWWTQCVSASCYRTMSQRAWTILKWYWDTVFWWSSIVLFAWSEWCFSLHALMLHDSVEQSFLFYLIAACIVFLLCFCVWSQKHSFCHMVIHYCEYFGGLGDQFCDYVEGSKIFCSNFQAVPAFMNSRLSSGTARGRI